LLHLTSADDCSLQEERIDMATVIEGKKVPKGGSFFLEDQPAETIFTPEDLSDEHRMIAQTAREFFQKEILPRDAEIESKDYAVHRELLRRAGELGLLAIEIPVEYGGSGLDLLSSIVASEQLSGQASFSGTLGAHTTIGMLPIAYFGTEEQKRKYLPRMATGEYVGAYALTEAGSGSDALGARTRAVLSRDGKHYLLTGQKMWITNAGFADVFIVFAKVEGRDFTAFIVERQFPGVTVQKEEHKMGLNGSSTCAVNLEQAQVPVENVLGEIGRGHRIAFNILNLGRLKLGVNTIAGSKRLTTIATEYAKQRHQFGVPIASFGLIKHKLAEMAIRSYVGESALYRTVGMIEGALGAVNRSNSEEVLRAIEGYAVECSIIKVFGSETLGYSADEAVQVFGGNGYSRDYPVERAYRDSRISRIYEGTNEINRLIISGQLLRRSARGELGLVQAAQKLMDEIQAPPVQDIDEGLFAAERVGLRNAKKVAIAVLGLAAQKYRDQVQQQQEVLAAASDILIDIYAAESAMLRTSRLVAKRGESDAWIQIAATQVFTSDALERARMSARAAFAAMSEGDQLQMLLAVLRRLLRPTQFNTVRARRQIADRLIETNGYSL
jgi:alkylation response protein AidB-like acyl-CoA dehydrogenase